jgi:hypothetical protein
MLFFQASDIQKNSMASLQAVIGMTSGKTINRLLKPLGYGFQSLLYAV